MRSVGLVCLFLIGLSSYGSETGTPNFSGQWRLVKEQSDLGGFTPPDSLKKTVILENPNLRVHTDQTVGGKTTTQDMTYFTNGFETKNFVNGVISHSAASWDGGTLEIHTNLQDAVGTAIVIEENWSLAQDKRMLTTLTKITTGKGATTTKLLWKKED